MNSLFELFRESLSTDMGQRVFELVFNLAPIWIPLIIFEIFWPTWVNYVRSEFFFKQKYKTLEIKLPKEMLKSPLAMELFLTTLHQTGGEGTWYDKYWLGKTRPWFSLEIVSIEGVVRFFIWTREGMRNFIESSLYAQFPGIEVYDVPDYSLGVHHDPEIMNIWATEIMLTKPDPYPIKTYVDYGLDRDPKEEFKVDPLAPFLEFLGSVGFNQQIWLQIIVRAHKAERKKGGMRLKMVDGLKEDSLKIINEILMRDPKTKISGKPDEDGKVARITLTKGEEEVVASIERNMAKQQFDIGIRALYIAKKENFNPGNISGILGNWKQFSSETLNGFKPNSEVGSPSFSFPWQDYKEIRQNGMRKSMLENYKRRAFFYGPYVGRAFTFSTEELATVFHFPGQVAPTPTLTRIPSKKGQPPANLPI